MLNMIYQAKEELVVMGVNAEDFREEYEEKEESLESEYMSAYIEWVEGSDSIEVVYKGISGNRVKYTIKGVDKKSTLDTQWGSNINKNNKLYTIVSTEKGEELKEVLEGETYELKTYRIATGIEGLDRHNGEVQVREKVG